MSGIHQNLFFLNLAVNAILFVMAVSLVISFFVIKKMFLRSAVFQRIQESTPLRRILECMIFCLLTILLVLNFQFNIFSIANPGWFDTFQSDSESHVIDRIRLGETSDLGFACGQVLEGKPYLQEIGLQAIGFAGVSHLCTGKKFDQSGILSVFYFFNCFLLAVIASGLIFYLGKLLGGIAALGLFLTFLFSVWPIAFSRNLCHVLWTYYLPLLTVLLYLHVADKHRSRKTYWLCFILVTASFSLKFACGYPYLTTLVTMAEIPVIFYAFLRKQSFPAFLKNSLLPAAGAFVAFVFTLLLNFIQMYFYLKSSQAAFQFFMHTVNKRLGILYVPMEDVFVESFSIDNLRLLNEYLWKQPVLADSVNMGTLTLLFLFVCVLLIVFGNRIAPLRRKLRLLYPWMAVSWISYLAPVSWYIIGKGHSSIHRHMNYVLWSFPTLMLILPFSGMVLYYVFFSVFKGSFRIDLRIPLLFLKRVFVPWTVDRKLYHGLFLVAVIVSAGLYYKADCAYAGMLKNHLQCQFSPEASDPGNYEIYLYHGDRYIICLNPAITEKDLLAKLYPGKKNECLPKLRSPFYSSWRIYRCSGSETH